jgi:hypothetical protein
MCGAWLQDYGEEKARKRIVREISELEGIIKVNHQLSAMGAPEFGRDLIQRAQLEAKYMRLYV